MDDHASRVLAQVRDSLTRVQAGEDVDLPELQASVAGAAAALDNANAEVRKALEGLDADLEIIRFTVSDDDQSSAVLIKAAHLLALLRDA